MTIKFIIFCVFSINWYLKQIRVKRINKSFTLSLEMAPVTSKWKKIEHTITFISASKKCAKVSTGDVEIKKRSKWKKLRWDFRMKFDFFIWFRRNIVTISFYMLRSLLTGLKPSYCKKETCTYTRSMPTIQSGKILPSKWKKIEHSIHFISSTRRSVKEKSSKPSENPRETPIVLENWKTLRQLLSKKDRKCLMNSIK